MSTKITVIPGDGIGPSLTEATIEVLKKLECDFEYEYAQAGITSLDKGNDLLPQDTIDLIAKNKIALKGPLTTPSGGGFTSINVTLRRKFDLYANVRPVVTYEGTKARYENIDILTIRENTEGLYCGAGQVVSEDGETAESKSVVTKKGCDRVLNFAYNLARKKGRKQIHAFHKANILKSTSGLFLSMAREAAKKNTDIESKEMIVDNACMQLVMNPNQFDMIVTTNLFGDIVSDLCAGLVGGLGMAPGANIGDDVAIFEAVHGSAPDIAGKNLANPSSLMLAAALMLDHLDMADKAERLRNAIADVIKNKDRCTADLGGNSGTTDFTAAVLERL
ncbi:MAG: isocitrate dehydrogenase [Bacteriovorax sp. MedPE-SWde]|nr:MAG: isocitrate dehydrogenase [Bacteriovorax sp. MedPE-SWde]